jgi:hypothetical protein
MNKEKKLIKRLKWEIRSDGYESVKAEDLKSFMKELSKFILKEK